MIFGKKSSEDIEKLEAEVEALESKNKLMLEALEFYADSNNW